MNVRKSLCAVTTYLAWSQLQGHSGHLLLPNFQLDQPLMLAKHGLINHPECPRWSQVSEESMLHTHTDTQPNLLL